MFDNQEITELTAKLGGIILKKAELENNFTNVYSRVFENIVNMERFEGDDFLFVLGEIGG